METCETCKYYTGPMGMDCRRHAPIEKGAASGIALWPIVMKDYWCGDHESKVEVTTLRDIGIVKPATRTRTASN